MRVHSSLSERSQSELVEDAGMANANGSTPLTMTAQGLTT